MLNFCNVVIVLDFLVIPAVSYNKKLLSLNLKGISIASSVVPAISEIIILSS